MCDEAKPIEEKEEIDDLRWQVGGLRTAVWNMRNRIKTLEILIGIGIVTVCVLLSD